MKNSIISLLLFLCLPCTNFAQERYQDNIFKNVKMKTYAYSEKNNEFLLADVYSYEKDEEKKRPLLIYVHGGGFASGKRDEKKHNEFCKDMAKKGYVTATIDYTLWMKDKTFSCDQLSSVKIETFKLTANDISRAVNFFIEKKDDFGIDTTKIILLGSSAGAEAILHAAYWSETRKDEEGKVLLSEKFRYAGIISMAGAITSLKLINAGNVIPTQLFHGTCDNLVPYSEAPHHYCDMGKPGYLVLYGGYAIAEHLRSLGKSYYLVTACNGGHEWAGRPLYENIPQITDFLYNDVLKRSNRQLHVILPTDRSDCPEYSDLNFCD